MPAQLTPRQRQIVGLVAEGLTVDEIAEELDLSRTTVRTRLWRVAELLAGGRRVTLDQLPSLLEEADRAA